MVMKRKLPSQSNKFDEELVTQAEDKTLAADKPSDGHKAAAADTPIAPKEDNIDILEDIPPPPGQKDAKFDLANSPFSMPEDIPDPFVKAQFDEEDMVLETPVSRPDDHHEAMSSNKPPHQHNISTEAILGGNDNKQYSNETVMMAEDTKEAVIVSDDNQQWDLDDFVDMPVNKAASAPFADEPDRSPFDSAPAVESPKTPPWKKKSSGEKTILPGDTVAGNVPNVGADIGTKTGGAVSVILIIMLVGGVFFFYQNKDTAIESLSRWTGTLNDVAQDVPITTVPNQEDPLQAEAIVRNDDITPPTPEVALAPQEQEPSNIKLEILDVTPDEAGEPIVGDEELDIPEDVDRFAALQEAIARKRADRRKETSARLEDDKVIVDPTTLPPDELAKRNMKIIGQTNATLEEYRKALSDPENAVVKPRPGQFFDERRTGDKGELLRPPSTRKAKATNKKVEPETFGNQLIEDPSELVTQEQDDGIRKLDDFNVTLFDPGKPKVRIPRGVSPRLSASDFPPLEVLSFVPDYGIIGLNRGQEGVLLIGEVIEGWELINVFGSYAEFHKGEIKRIVTIKNANN